MSELGGYDLGELKDSRMLYLRDPPRFIPILALMIVLILAGVIVWSCMTVDAEEIENQGMVVDPDACST